MRPGDAPGHLYRKSRYVGQRRPIAVSIGLDRDATDRAWYGSRHLIAVLCSRKSEKIRISRQNSAFRGAAIVRYVAAVDDFKPLIQQDLSGKRNRCGRRASGIRGRGWGKPVGRFASRI